MRKIVPVWAESRIELTLDHADQCSIDLYSRPSTPSDWQGALSRDDVRDLVLALGAIHSQMRKMAEELER